MKETLIIVDEVILVHRNGQGQIIHQRSSKSRLRNLLVRMHMLPANSLTNTGFASVAGLLLTDVGDTAYDYIAIGTGTGAANSSNTQLGTETKRKASVGTRVTTNATNDTAQLVVTFASADGLSGTDNITEAGVLNAASNGTLIMRQIFTAEVMAWDSGDTLQVTIKIQVKQGT